MLTDYSSVNVSLDQFHGWADPIQTDDGIILALLKYPYGDYLVKGTGTNDAYTVVLLSKI